MRSNDGHMKAYKPGPSIAFSFSFNESALLFSFKGLTLFLFLYNVSPNKRNERSASLDEPKRWLKAQEDSISKSANSIHEGLKA